jgi:ribosomal protein S18 acetylase RimI-like enzyme
MQVKTMEIKHVAEIISIHMEAFKGYMNVMLGYSYNTAFFKWFVNNETIHLIGLNDEGSISGYVVGAALGYQKALTKTLLPTVVLELIKRPWILLHWKVDKAIWTRFKGLFHKDTNTIEIPPIYDRRIISMVAIGVSQSTMNKGLALLLEKEFIKQARIMGFNFARLSVYQRNIRARRFYEKLGWETENASMDIIVYFKKIV